MKIAESNYQSAAQEFRRALKRAGDDAVLRFSALANLGAALYYCGEYADAERNYDSAIISIR